MIHAGLVSITFRQLTPDAIVELVRASGLTHVEWGGDVHCPHGDTDAARRVGAMTRDAGLTPAVYGSYLRFAEPEGPSHDDVVASAEALGAESVRVWAGRRDGVDADDAYRAAVVGQAQRFADRCRDAGLGVVLEYHRKTLTDTHAGAVNLLTAIDRPNVRLGWQPVPDRSDAQNLADLEDLIARDALGTVHVFQWTEPAERNAFVRHPLAEGEAAWWAYFEALARRDNDSLALIEFVEGDAPGRFADDAACLRRWLDAANG